MTRGKERRREGFRGAGEKAVGAVVWGGVFGCLVACGGGEAKPAEAPPSDVQCPTGQKFDGTYCVADPAAPPLDIQPTDPGPVAPVEPKTQPGVTEPSVTPTPPEQAEVAPPTSTEPATPARDFAAPVDVTMAASAAPLIQYLASAHLPAGARAFGAPFAGQFSEGQVLEQRVSLSVGKCYTVVAAGVPPVGELNIELYDLHGRSERLETDTPFLTDTDRGPQAVLGRKNECFSPPAGRGPYLLVVTVAQGRGVAAAQVFEK